MQKPTETEALADYVKTRSDTAFERLVAQHIDMVFGCAIRRCADRELSEEISQNVFAILARKAQRLKAGSGLAGWLHKTTLYETKKALRGESRRNRKMKALAEHELSKDQNRDATDHEVLPQLDEAIDELPDADRHLLLMRFFEGKNFREIAETTGKSEAASQKQASRAIEKLGRVLKRRGVVAGTTALGTILAAESAKAAPAGIAGSVSSSAFAGASTLATSTLITNAIQTMTYAKTKIAIFAAAAAAVPIGAQWNTIGNLKEEARTHRDSEVEFVQQGERLAKLEEQIASLPEGFLANFEHSKQAPKLQEKITALGKRAKSEPRMAQATRRKTGSAATREHENGEEEAEADPLTDLLADAMADLENMMENPAMRAMAKKQMAAQLEVSHGEFVKYVTDDEEKRAKIRQLLLDRLLNMANMGIKLTGDPTSEQNAAAIGEISLAGEKYDEQLKALMGEQGWGEFERFEASTAERQELSTFRDTLEESGLELTFETEQQLMTIMFEEGDKVDYTSILDDDDDDTGLESSILSLSGKSMVQYHKRRRIRHEKILDRAREVLSPAQLLIFEKNQAAHLDMLQDSLENSPLWQKAKD